MLIYYQPSIKGLAAKLILLYEVTARKPKTLTWTEKEAAAFSDAKTVLAALLVHPDQTPPPRCHRQ